MRKLYMGLIAVVCVVLTSCSTNQRVTSLTYFEDLKGLEDGTINTAPFKMTIVPDDELVITVNSRYPQATAQYNLPLGNPAKRGELEISQQPAIQTYVVDQAGDIYFPVIGKIHVQGMTIRELTEFIEKKVSAEVANPVVRVEMVNFKVNVMGEVKDPGVQKVERQRYTLLDALAAAGDLTEYGERENVLLIRDENGKLEYHHFNLNDSHTLESPYFYLRQNDVIVVEPNDIRKDNSRYNQFNAYKISVISTVVSACSVLASLIIALAVK